jgi:CRP-like cAMP-binding protein
MMIMAKENVLTTLTSGDFFGEVSLFDHGPRSADVVANRDSLLLRITAASFARLVQEAPQLAAPFLQSICITLTARIRADNKRFKDSIKLIRSASHYNNL